MTEFDLIKTIQQEANALSGDAVQNQAEHAKKIESLIIAFRILVKT